MPEQDPTERQVEFYKSTVSKGFETIKSQLDILDESYLLKTPSPVVELYETQVRRGENGPFEIYSGESKLSKQDQRIIQASILGFKGLFGEANLDKCDSVFRGGSEITADWGTHSGTRQIFSVYGVGSQNLVYRYTYSRNVPLTNPFGMRQRVASIFYRPNEGFLSFYHQDDNYYKDQYGNSLPVEPKIQTLVQMYLNGDQIEIGEKFILGANTPHFFLGELRR